MVKIMHISEAIAFGGAERVICSYVTALAKDKNLDIILVVPDKYYNDFFRNICSNEVKLIPYNKNFFSKLSFNRFKLIKNLIVKYKPDIIHTHDPRMLIAVSLMKKFFTIKHFHTQHSKEVWRKSYLIEKLFNLNADHYIAVSSEVKNFLINKRGVDTNNISIIFNINIHNKQSEYKKSIGKNQIIKLIAVGRIEKEKGFDLLLKALAKIKEKISDRNFELFVVGSGSMLPYLKQLTVQFGLVEKVNFIGWRNDVFDLLLASDIFILPSRNEGMPLSLVEAMTAGLPSVCFDVSGVKDLIRNNIEGIVCKPEDIDELADGIIKLILDEKLRFGIGERAKQRIDELSKKNNMADRLIRCYFGG
ncbi:Glycosyltransferase involved in cell wall bisynthesis [Carboxydocella sporoproducens DSM 16521]|uniref:Glycosyltransferase involved in cell wall bisynthesis n=2 Tax=Carboxydocella TaxID=178898 RepID=A0A1T4P1I4_9FIRM|nr:MULTISPECIES: glycosyltransferase family 4 protein [Carboxydocella]AVX19585.1 Glycosyltransferase involved in cell wall bisynthesis [Carboxydocella thermautotrophica]AVX30000.1 Glycosyltransferase involved in cell wall bisynthesis [Carboxydocella thermautotrophica]SJZ85321.1 Glycosyltransferase involved in cell wall bisynthesis [Carboxydocella sporoproducens DSM 16521]